jgi:hypothetical protein
MQGHAWRYFLLAEVTPVLVKLFYAPFSARVCENWPKGSGCKNN